jgi:hypothetical protein
MVLVLKVRIKVLILGVRFKVWIRFRFDVSFFRDLDYGSNVWIRVLILRFGFKFQFKS